MKRVPRGRLLLLSAAARLNFKTPSSFSSFNFFTSKSENPTNENPVDEQDVSSAELKTQIDKFYKGDFEAIPTIFESILKRKLAGKHEDSDDELMNEFIRDQPHDVRDKEFDSDSDSNPDTDSDSD